MTITTTIFQPNIKQNFNPLLLLDSMGITKWRVDNIIIPKSKKKIRLQDVGRQREFDKLIKEFEEVYERKKIEKEIYDAKIKKLNKERPYIPSTGGTMQFKRFKP